MKEFTITLTVNRHIKARSEHEALNQVRSELDGNFDVIDEEIKVSADQAEQDEAEQIRDEKRGLYADKLDISN